MAIGTMDDPPVAEVAGAGAPIRSAAPVDDHQVPELPKFNWKVVGKCMMTRRAYRRYHGSHRTSIIMQNWGISFLFLFASAFYAVKSGSLRPFLEPACPEGGLLARQAAEEADGPSELNLFDEARENPQGMVVILVWQNGSEALWQNLLYIGFAIVLTYVLVNYQRSLGIKYAGSVTLLALLILVAMALETAVSNEFPFQFEPDDLWSRVMITCLWVVIQVLLLCVGVVTNVVLPYLGKSGMRGRPWLKSSNLYSGAIEKGMEEIWQRAPNLRARLLQEYSSHGTPLYSFCAEYYRPGRWFWMLLCCCCCGCPGTSHARYVGGLDSKGAPHGLGVWHDTHEQGELLVGRFMHGQPLSPHRVRTNNGSAFVSFRIAILSCRTDAVTSRGTLNAVYGKHRVDGGSEPAPLQAAVASLECNTSGMYYKGFPKIQWLQRPVELDNIDSFKDKAKKAHIKRHAPPPPPKSWKARCCMPFNRFSTLKEVAQPAAEGTCTCSKTSEVAVSLMAQPCVTPNVDCNTSTTAVFVELEPLESVSSDNIVATEESCLTCAATGDGPEAEVTDKERFSTKLPACSLREGTGFPGSKGCFGTFKKTKWKRLKQPVVWARHLDAELIGQPLSTWLMHKQNATLDILKPHSMRLQQEAEGGYDALFFVHGYNSSQEHVLGLLGQLLALGSFPGDLMPVIFAWPCTKSYQYLWGHKVTQSDYVAQKMIEALQYLEADGCRKVHILCHSMGARTMAGASERLAQFFPPLPDESPGFHKTLPPETSTSLATSQGLELASVTFLSPDMDYGEYVGRCAPRLRSVCPLVTVYGDEHDTALGMSRDLNNWWYFLHPSSMTPGLKEETKRLGVQRAKPLGRHCDTCIRGNGEVLDVDFVSTTFLSSNVHTVRHNYFHLNREMVEDIRDLMVTGRRAAERPYRLEWIAQHTYSFVVAPSCVVAA